MFNPAPALFPNTVQYMWNYSSQPDENLGGLSPNLWQGRVLGGGTAVNGMGYCRGATSVFEQWAQISGNPALRWNSMLASFKTITRYTFQPADYNQTVNTTVFGDGPLSITRPSELTHMEAPYLNTLRANFNLTMVDAMDGHGLGATMGLETIREENRTRSYARNTFGWAMGNRANVQVLPNSWVQRIGFEGNRAINISYINTETSEETTLCADEIIVSAGAINSPKLLLQSGVGSRQTLEALNIPVIADIPGVGARLWDHHYSYIEFQVTDNVETMWQITQNTTGARIAAEMYAINYSGPMGISHGKSYATSRLPDSIFSQDGVNGSFYTSMPSDRPHVLFAYNAVPFTPSNVSTISVWAALVQPEASGHLTINSSDYNDPPIIHSNYYGSLADKAAIRYAYSQLRSVLRSSAEFQQNVVGEIFPGDSVHSDDALWRAIQRSASSFHHPVGTVPLGDVLDSNWRIKGLDGIRVVDSSAIPTLPSCHTQAHVYAIANIAAQDIVRDDNL